MEALFQQEREENEWEPLLDDSILGLGLSDTAAGPDQTAINDSILSAEEFDELERRFQEAAIYLYEGENNIKFDTHPETPRALRAYNRAHSNVAHLCSLVASLILLALALVESPNIGSPLPTVPVVYTVALELACLATIGAHMILTLQWLGTRKFAKQSSNLIKAVVLAVIFVEAFVILVRRRSRFRVTRALRPYFLLSNHFCVAMRRVLRQTIQSIGPIADMVLLLLFFMFMFSIIGFFSFSTNPEDPFFDTLHNSFVNLFVLVTTANYPDVMMPAYSLNRLSFLFFFCYLVFGLYFLMNLLLAVVYDTYRQKERNKFQKLFLHQREALRQAYRLLKDDRRGGIPFSNFRGLLRYRGKNRLSRLQIRLKFVALNVGETEALNLEEFYSFYEIDKLKWHQKRTDEGSRPRSRFARPNCFLKAAYLIRQAVVHWSFELVVNLVIIANTITIVFNAATTKREDARNANFNRIHSADIVFVCVYWVEMLLKNIGLGPRAFFAQGWNRFDIFVTLMGTLGLGLEFKVTLFTSLRQLRILRLFKVKRRYREVLSTMFQLIPKLLSFLFALMIVFYFFAIIGTELFAGKLHVGCCGAYYNNQTSVNRYYLNSFDNLITSYVTLFELMVVNNWHIIMNGFVAVTGQWARLYFMIFYIVVVVGSVCQVVVLNVVVAFILESFLSRMTFERAMNRDDDTQNQVAMSVHLPMSDFVKFTRRKRENELLVVNNHMWVRFIGKRAKTIADVQQLLFQSELEQWMLDDMVLRTSMRKAKAIDDAEISTALGEGTAVGATLLRSSRNSPAKHATAGGLAGITMPWLDDGMLTSTPRPGHGGCGASSALHARGDPDGEGMIPGETEIVAAPPSPGDDGEAGAAAGAAGGEGNVEDQLAFARRLAEQETAAQILRAMRTLSTPALRQILAQYQDTERVFDG